MLSNTFYENTTFYYTIIDIMFWVLFNIINMMDYNSLNIKQIQIITKFRIPLNYPVLKRKEEKRHFLIECCMVLKSWAASFDLAVWFALIKAHPNCDLAEQFFKSIMLNFICMSLAVTYILDLLFSSKWKVMGYMS